MATLYSTDGSSSTLQPANGIHWTLEEYYRILATDTIDIVSTVDGRFLVIDDYGKLRERELNVQATRLYIYGREDWIAGAALVIDTRAELEGEEDEE